MIPAEFTPGALVRHRINRKLAYVSPDGPSFYRYHEAFGDGFTTHVSLTHPATHEYFYQWDISNVELIREAEPDDPR